MRAQRLAGDVAALDDFAREFAQRRAALPRRVGADEAQVERGLAKLVLALIELLRRLLEKQALRRIERGSLTEDEIERMGLTFLRLDQKMAELKALFGLEDADLELRLGALEDLA
ncbi:MAG: gas vesicle protein K [Chloroflexi bacterium]|nr:gas vesicle protein K [Chloroflexota bacterium]MBI4505422.1 gas vesicle protein K [Chloroflexota bacterium]